VKALLARRAATEIFVVEHRRAIANPAGIVDQLNRFPGGTLDVKALAAAVEPALQRNNIG
jgi:hypothetical protein